MARAAMGIPSAPPRTSFDGIEYFVLLDGIEYSILIIPVLEGALDPRQMRLIERETKPLPRPIAG